MEFGTPIIIKLKFKTYIIISTELKHDFSYGMLGKLGDMEEIPKISPIYY